MAGLGGGGRLHQGAQAGGRCQVSVTANRDLCPLLLICLAWRSRVPRRRRRLACKPYHRLAIVPACLTSLLTGACGCFTSDVAAAGAPCRRWVVHKRPEPIVKKLLKVLVASRSTTHGGGLVLPDSRHTFVAGPKCGALSQCISCLAALTPVLDLAVLVNSQGLLSLVLRSEGRAHGPAAVSLLDPHPGPTLACPNSLAALLACSGHEPRGRRRAAATASLRGRGSGVCGDSPQAAAPGGSGATPGHLPN